MPDEQPNQTVEEEDDDDRFGAERPVELAEGRKEEAEDVDLTDLDLNDRPSDAGREQEEGPEREEINEETAKQARRINPGAMAGARIDPSAKKTSLPPSAREKEIAKHDDLLKRMATADKHKLREYYRILRDIE